MKKILIAIAMTVSAAGGAAAQGGFDGRAGESLFAQAGLKAPAVSQARPADMMPARVLPAFVSGNPAAADSVIDSAIAYAKANGRSAGLVSGLECLRRSGTLEQKEAFAYGPGTFVLPETCYTAKAPAAPLKCVSQTVCEWITETIIRNNCGPNGTDCMETTVEVLRKTCRNLCE